MKLADNIPRRPEMRSGFRMFGGKLYFTWRRYLTWLWQLNLYAGSVRENPLPFMIYRHKTPLLRHLRNIDMWLQYNKITNLKISTARINGITIKPGQVFSFWRSVGKPAKRKGYSEGMVLCNGSFYPEVGGGLCQLSNLIYWMTLHTPLTVTERWRHNYDVFPDADRTQPFGSGATVAYNYVDLQIRNDTNADFQLLVWVGDRYLHGEWRSEVPQNFIYEVYETEHRFTHELWGGYMRHNILRRKVFNMDGSRVTDEFVTENHAIMMYEPMLPSLKQGF